jgi:propanol-preferring alcohol dehydrogenase
MQALQLTAWRHDPELRDVAEPDPGPGEVVVKIGGAGVCHSDLHLLYEFAPGVVPYEPPFTLGHENAGWVHALGAGVTGLEVGQPVAVFGAWGCGHCIRCRRGDENYCVNAATAGASAGLGRDGGMAPYLLVPSARLVVPLGDLDPVAAAPLTDAGLTPYHAIRRSLPKLVPGSTAVAIGVGGLGHMGVQLLSALTATRVIAVDQRPAALDLARAHGADLTVTSGPDAAAEIRDATGGVGADVVLDFVGVEATMQLGVSIARPLGDLTVVGIGGGAVPFGFFSTPYEVSLQTTYWGSITELMELLDLARRGIVKAEYTEYALADAPQAYEALRAGTLRGRAVVVPPRRR